MIRIEDESFSIGVGITTYNRFDRFKVCFESLIANSRDVDEILIVEDCSNKDVEKYDEYFKRPFLKNIKILRHKVNRGVGISKNDIMQYFINKNTSYFFTLEDDMKLLSPDIFKEYVEASIKSGYQYLNFAEHGTMNTTYYVKDVNGVNLKFYPNIVGSFTLYTPELIKKIGYHDPRFFNAMEHVEYTYRASKRDLTSRFWHFADVMNNTQLIEEQEDSIEDSSIRPREDWGDNVDKGFALFQEMHGVHVRDIPGR